MVRLVLKTLPWELLSVDRNDIVMIEWDCLFSVQAAQGKANLVSELHYWSRGMGGGGDYYFLKVSSSVSTKYSNNR